IGEGDVLQDREKPMLTLQALDEVRHGMQSHQRMEWSAVMARGEVGGTYHGQGRGGEQSFQRHTSAELRQCMVKNRTRRGFFDKLYQGFDGISKLDTCHHDCILPFFPRIHRRYRMRSQWWQGGGQSAPPSPRMLPRGYECCLLRSSQ